MNAEGVKEMEDSKNISQSEGVEEMEDIKNISQSEGVKKGDKSSTSQNNTKGQGLFEFLIILNIWV